MINLLNSKPHIIVIDEDKKNLENVENNLKDFDATISSVAPSKEAIKRIAEHTPDLLIMNSRILWDNNNSIYDQIRNHVETENLPVLFMIETIDTDIVDQIFSVGGTDYLTFPINPNEFKSRIGCQIKMIELGRQIESMTQSFNDKISDRKDYLALAAHDMKNPLFNISMLSKFIRDDAALSRDEVIEFVNDIVISSNNMIQLITNFLDLNKLEQGKVNLVFEDVHINNIVLKTIIDYTNRANKKNINIRLNSLAKNAMVYADQFAASQVLDNVISNAVKYSPFDKDILIKLSSTPNAVLIEINDKGSGFLPEEMDRLFEKFAKFSSKPTGDESSTGLGLSIVKSYMDAMNGKIWCECDEKKGTTFFIEFPKSKSI